MKTTDLARSTGEFIRHHNLLLEGDSVLVGLSGGPDSTCLLAVLNSLRDAFRLRVSAVYVDHRLRPDETPAEEAFCRKVCEAWGITFLTRTIDVASYRSRAGLNVHEAARELRYRAFDEAAAETAADRIALAHTADDQAETIFMRLARGAGPAGLAGIPLRRGKVIRPFLETGRGEIEAFLAQAGITPVVDSSNLKADYFRNMVRMTVMPALKRANPNLVHTLVHTMQVLREEERFFDILVTKALMKLISRKTAERIELFLSPLEAMETVLLRRVLRRALQETVGLRGVGFVHIEEMISLVRSGGAGSRLRLPKGIRVVREYALLVITSEEPVRLDACDLPVPGEAVLVGANLVVRAAVDGEADAACDGRACFLVDADRVHLPLLVRPRKQGDVFYPAGFGRRKKIQDLLVDLKVPRDERDRVPLVVSGNDIVWVAGFRGDERFRATGHTKKIIRLGIVKGKF